MKQTICPIVALRNHLHNLDSSLAWAKEYTRLRKLADDRHQELKTQILSQPIVRMECACCGNSVKGRQYWNQDDGYGLCNDCANSKHFATNTEAQTGYNLAHGYAGVNFLIDPTADADQDFWAEVLS